MKNKSVTILAISGSLRSNSSNTNILRALAKLAPENVKIILFNGLDLLPHFSPEKDTEPANLSVKKLRAALKEADGIIICTPEYAFGVPGTLKNAIDWVVSSGELNEKPGVAISASPLATGGDKAMASLLNTFTAVGIKLPEGGALSIGIIKKKMNEQGEITDDETIQSLKLLLGKLLDTIHKN